MKKTTRYAEFAVYIRNVTPTALRVQVPFGVVPNAATYAPEMPHERPNEPEIEDSLDDEFDPAEPSEWPNKTP